MLIVDGVKYKLWIPEDEEKDFHPMVKEYSKEIFNEDSIYFDIKHKLSSKSGIAAIPDAYVITLSKPYEWYIVENELASHQVYNHIVPQISKFVDSIEELETQRDIRDILNNMVEQDKDIKAFIEKKTGKDSYRFLSELVSLSPKIALIIDEITPEVDKASKSLNKLANTKIIEFKTFVKYDDPNVHAHLFEPLYETKKERKITVKVNFPLVSVPLISKGEMKSLKEGIVLIAPSKPQGVIFLVEHNAWGFIRLKKKTDYFALYVSSPESMISYFGKVEDVVKPRDPNSPISLEEARQYETYKEGKKVVVLKPNSLKKMENGIPRGVKKGKLQGIKFVTLNQFINAETTDDL